VNHSLVISTAFSNCLGQCENTHIYSSYTIHIWAGYVARMGGGGGGCTGCWWGNLRERGRWGDPDVHGRILDSQEVGGGRGDWMELAQDRDRWWALVSTIKKLQVP
jgi:hypothetical protein